MNASVAIIRTGTANLASVSAAFDRLSVNSRIIETTDQLQPQEAVVLPGVGTFSAGMDALNRHGWTEVLSKRLEDNCPTLAICLGLQLLAQASEESPQQSGVGLLPARVSRFPNDVTSPQLGWNRVDGSAPFPQSGFAYYANSFCIQEFPELRAAGWNVATSHHGVEFVAAIQKGNWLACQFHPELSGQYGLRLLQNWINNIERTSIAAASGGARC